MSIKQLELCPEGYGNILPVDYPAVAKPILFHRGVLTDLPVTSMHGGFSPRLRMPKQRNSGRHGLDERTAEVTPC
jgi:hypothetical protein